MKRKEGYYWIKRQEKWYVGYYDGHKYWQRVGVDNHYTDFDLEEINETEIKR